MRGSGRLVAVAAIAVMFVGLIAVRAQETRPAATSGPTTQPAANAHPRAAQTAAQVYGRSVRIVSLGFRNQKLEDVVKAVDQEGAKGADLIVLPETWRGSAAERLAGPATKAMTAMAKKHKTYIVSPIYREVCGRRINSAILIDRHGTIVGIYDKVYPYWSEFDLNPPCKVGHEAPVVETDFGKIGMAICFDVNFPSVWQRLGDQGAELVVWPSAYSAGTSLQAHAINHHYYVVTATLQGDCLVYDITGEEILYQKRAGLNIARITLDLDRGIYHQNFNIGKRDKLLKERAADVVQEKWMEREQWFVLRAKRKGVSARELARQYGLEELRDYLDRSRRAIDRRRGWEFAEKTMGNPK